MAGHLSITRFVSAAMLLDIVLLALVSFSGTQADAVLAGLLPGSFGPGMGAHMTGNRLLGALILLLNALAFLGAGFAVLLSASRHARAAGSGGIWRLLYGTGQSRDDIAAASLAVAEDQKSEIHKLRSGRTLVQIGAVLLLLAFPAVCFTYAQADANGVPLLRGASGPVANAALTARDTVAFAAGEVLDAVLLDIPRVYDWHLSPLRPAPDHAWMRPLVLAFHILAKLIVLALLFAAWRGGKLRAFALRMAGPVAVPAVAVPPEAPVPHAANDYHPPAIAPEPETPAVPAPPLEESVHPGHDHGSEFALEPAAETQLPSPAPEAAAEEQSEPVRALLLDAPADAEQEQVAEAYSEPAMETDAPSQPAEETVEETPQPVRAERPRLFLVHPQAEETAPLENISDGEEIGPPLQAAMAEAPLAAEDRFSDAPLALHALRNPDEIIVPAADNHEAAEEERGSPYKKTALHVLPEFDA